MILVPADTPGIEMLRADDRSLATTTRRMATCISASPTCGCRSRRLILGEGRGFEIAQGRLGPGRIHHCMRAIGQAEAALELMCRRSLGREAFGKKLAQLGANYDIIADCRMEIEMARLLCLKAAWMMDQGDMRAAAPWISQIKVVAPQVALKVCDEAVQMFGAGASARTSRSPGSGRICGPCASSTGRTRCIAARWPAGNCANTPTSGSDRWRRMPDEGSRQANG